MSNVLKVSIQTAIITLASRGYSIRQIAKQLGVNRRTVRRYVLDSGHEVIPPGDGSDSKCTTPGDEVTPGSGESKCTTPEPEVSAGSRSCCEPWREAIESMVESGLSAQRVFQDLRVGHGFTGSYSAIKRFVAKLRRSAPQRVWRVECEPGQELQIDFMAGPMLPDPRRPGKRKRCWILRAVLSYSRKGYSEAVWRQDSESFLRALENALRAFGGVPALLNLDNLKAAVTKADWCDPELSPKFAEFCRHYGMTPMPCRPYCPQHKGKVERSVHYVRHNALAGHQFEALNALNSHLSHWEATVADTRIHGTTRQQVGAQFKSVERLALKALPIELFAAFTEVKRAVNRDSYVEVAKAYYQTPPEYIGHSVWARYDGRQVRLFNAGLE
jgi:transposase